eukprot:GEMP01043366.1.p1 GENE.GEMP01043366.1~~GEMP01043366.1.p1  ORF type:complete len:379 (+),score=76.66 GEMP01043366.1:103-1239(+)
MTLLADLYEVLGVHRESSVDDIKKAYRRAALKHHPDKGGDEEMFKEVNAAWETLGDEEKRRAYERQFFARSNSVVVPRQSSKERRNGFETKQRAKTQSFTTPSQPTTQASNHSSSTQPTPPPQNAPKQPQTSAKIPDDLVALTVKELKDLLSALGVRHDDCVEKTDLITRLNSRRKPPDRYRGKENVVPGGTCFPNSSLRIKVITVGAANVGKSCLIKRYCEGRFVSRYITTIGVDYGVKAVPNVHKHLCKVNFFDLSGQEDFKDIRIDFYRDGQGVLLCFDCTCTVSFRSLPQWMLESRMNGLDLENDNIVVALCSMKIDAPGRKVSRSEGQDFAKMKGFLYFEVSAQTGENVNEALNTVFEHVVAKQLEARSKMGL